MAGAANMRLRDALEEFITSETGDGGRGGTRSAQTTGAAVEMASQLLEEISGGQDAEQATPGQRARARATGGAGIDGAAGRAREMLGGR